MDERALATFKFGGKPNEIAADTLLNSLTAVTNIIHEINKEHGAGQPVAIKVLVPEPGSFLLKLAIDPAVTATADQLKLWVASLGSGAALLSILASLLAIRKHLKKDNPSTITDVGEDQTSIANSAGASITVNKNVYNTYNNNVIQYRIGYLFESMNADETLDEFDMLDPQGRQMFHADKNEFQSMASVTEQMETTGQKQIVTKRCTLPIVKLSFDPVRLWNVVYHARNIGVMMRDKAYIEKINTRKESFYAGDALEVELRIEQELHPTAHVFVDKRFEILTVYGKIEGPKQQQLPLSNETTEH